MAAHLFFGLSPLLQKFLSVITFATTESCDNNNNYCPRKISLNCLCTTVSTWNALVWPMAPWHVKGHLRKYLRVATQINCLNTLQPPRVYSLLVHTCCGLPFLPSFVWCIVGRVAILSAVSIAGHKHSTV